MEKHISQAEILNEISQELEQTLKSETNFAEINGTELFKQKTGFMNKIYMFLFSRLAGKLKVKITCYWNDRVLFEYSIPRD